MNSKAKNKRVVDATELSLDEWLELIKENDKKQCYLINDCCFPTDKMLNEYINKINEKSDDEVRYLISKFLISGGRYYSADFILQYFNTFTQERKQELLSRFTFYQRLTSIKDWHNVWPSITWVLDLLPHFPYEALNAIRSYFLAHCQFMTDQRFDGCSDARRLIEAKYIKHQLPVKQVLLDITSRDFELLTAYLYKNKAYSVKITPRSRDGGYDVLAEQKNERQYERLYIECKRYTENVGVKITRNVLGLLSIENATKGVVVTTSYFTKNAKNEAQKSNRLELINIEGFDEDMRKHVGVNWLRDIQGYVSEMKKELIDE
ncbi:restriction endonuclease [Klebsiella michiganensis]|uniref:restriction endonuclease n=1 Tax=Klebsiella michiganensis TaxID=1134687 RepID=UPI001CC8F12B|nr:restriction endonuclease [Klebsiella michiganensis]MBZ7619545.1 restriction endonuclease [Klebsiella michiganensis]